MFDAEQSVDDSMNIISPQVIDEHGLSSDEYDRILAILGRTKSYRARYFLSDVDEHCFDLIQI